MKLFNLFEDSRVVGFPKFDQLIDSLDKMHDGQFNFSFREAEQTYSAKFNSAKDYYNFLVKHFKKLGPTYQLYRAFYAPGYKTLINPKNKLGIHWSDIKVNPIGSSHRGKLFTLEAEVKATSIDWQKTFEAQFMIPYEREFVVTGSVTLSNVLDAQEKTIWTNDDPHIQWKTQ